MNVRFLEPARDEFLAAVEFYEQQASGLGSEFIDEIERAVELLRETPQIGSPFTDDTRRVLLRRFPYDIVYIVEPDVVLVVAVAHQRRKPGYWKQRD